MERLDDIQPNTGVAPPTQYPYGGGKKVEILPGASEDACTFCIYNEDHTLGNALRYMLMKNPDVEFCGYSAPHPSQPEIHLRVQMYDQKSAREAVLKALDDLEGAFLAIKEKYNESLASGDYEKFEDPVLSKENVLRMSEKVKLERGEGGDMQE